MSLLTIESGDGASGGEEGKREAARPDLHWS